MKQRFCRMLFCLAVLLASCALLAVGASAADPMSDFDFARYGSENPDLLRAYGPYIYKDELYLHYLQHGASEGRAAYSLRTGSPSCWRKTPSRPIRTNWLSPARRPD